MAYQSSLLIVLIIMALSVSKLIPLMIINAFHGKSLPVYGKGIGYVIGFMLKIMPRLCVLLQKVQGWRPIILWQQSNEKYRSVNSVAN